MVSVRQLEVSCTSTALTVWTLWRKSLVASPLQPYASGIEDELSYFGQEGMTEVQCGKVAFQFQCSSDSTNGTGVQGGQIPELIFYA